jgi:hypothetical protein
MTIDSTLDEEFNSRRALSKSEKIRNQKLVFIAFVKRINDDVNLIEKEQNNSQTISNLMPRE